MRDLTGQRVGAYDVGERLGAGGMAVVYRAVQRSLGREVALKVLAPSLAEDEAFAQRFQNEARTLAALDHPNILPIIDFENRDELCYLTMPLVRGGTLRDLMDRGPMHPAVAWRYLKETGEGLHHAHQAGVIHRDLKPSNILIHADGRALLADFGLARTASADANLTTVGFAIGTPGYMAPEQVLGKPIDRRADLYALGVITFEILTGRLPFRGETPIETVTKTVSEPVPSACAIRRELPDELDRLLEAVLAKDPERRPPTAAILVTELGRLPQRRTGGPGPAAGNLASVRTPPAPPPSPARPAAAVVQLRPPTSPSPLPGSAVALLEQQGVQRLRATQAFGLNAHWANALHAARATADARWPEVVRAAGLERYLVEDPLDNGERTTPVEYLSRLNEAFDLVLGSQSPERVRDWGRRATDRWLAMRGGRGHSAATRLLGRQRRVQALLRHFTETMDGVRGEHTHAFRQVDADRFWLVHYDNLYALGRLKREKSCHVWTASIESMLRWAGLANDWVVEEVECGCVTGTFDCVFAVRSARA